MKTVRSSLVLGVSVLLFASAGFAGEGPDVITLPASKGVIAFPHWKHQTLLKDDCSKCHPGDPGKITELGKEWGHKTCRGCHQNETIDSKKGPTVCFGCHKRPE